jgi:hypothetical protein
MKGYKLVFESVDHESLNNRSASVFEMIDFYEPTPRTPGVGLFQTKKTYHNERILELLENNLRGSFKVGESVIVEV